MSDFRAGALPPGPIRARRRAGQVVAASAVSSAQYVAMRPACCTWSPSGRVARWLLSR